MNYSFVVQEYCVRCGKMIMFGLLTSEAPPQDICSCLTIPLLSYVSQLLVAFSVPDSIILDLERLLSHSHLLLFTFFLLNFPFICFADSLCNAIPCVGLPLNLSTFHHT